MQIQNSDKASANYEDKKDAQRALVEELKVEWKLLWSERFDDKTKAEGVSIANYSSLKVDRGTVIHATRDFKPLNFREVLEQHQIEEPERFIQPNVNTGGWSRFIKTKITIDTHKSKSDGLSYPSKKNAGQQPKKSGRGWLHTV